MSGSATKRRIALLYLAVSRIAHLHDGRSAANISFCTHLLFCAKNVERIGDHTTNIAETVHYLVKGEPLTAERPKKDRTSLEHVETYGQVSCAYPLPRMKQPAAPVRAAA